MPPQSVSRSTDKPMTLAFLGCGNLGTAILSGILDSISSQLSLSQSQDHSDSGTITPSTSESSSSSAKPSDNDSFRTPNRFITLTRSTTSANRIRTAISANPSISSSVQILQNSNLTGIQRADAIILGCKPYMVTSILGAPGIQAALAGKLLISICAGVTVNQLSDALYTLPYETLFTPDSPVSNPCMIVRVMPNTAALVRESMTVIATSTPPLPEHYTQLVEWIFSRVGRVVTLPPSQMDVSTALCGSGPAFCALILESLSDGAVAMGLTRAEAQVMAAQTMRGAAGLVLNGEHPAVVRDKVTTPGGCTAGGLVELEEGGVRGVVGRAVRRAAVVAGLLGRGVAGVNGVQVAGSG